MKGFVVLAVVLLVLPLVHSQEVVEYDALLTIKGVYLFLNNPGQVQEKVTLVFSNTQGTPLKEVSYPFSAELGNLRISDALGELNFSTSVRSGKTYVTVVFRGPLEPAQNQTIVYEYIPVKSIQRRDGNSFILTSAQSILANVKNFKLVVFLPEGYVLSPEGVVPTSKDILSDGRSVILIWEILEPIPAELKGDFKIVIFYERLGWYPNIYQAVALLVVIFAGAVYAYRRKKTRIEEAEKEKEVYDKIDILKEDEQSILRIIIENNGIDQREVTRLTGFSKAKVSKILAELEKRGAIRKEQYGRRNKVFLTEKIKES
jgi:uncharacterized membrane protein